MAVNTTLAGLSQTAADNGPDGGADPPSALDDVLRYHGAFIAMLRDMIVPIGGIIPYDGLIADLKPNWKLCDGTNGTPDLRDRSIVGASATKALNSVGGSADAIVVLHTHTGTTGVETTDHTHGVIDPGHGHVTNIPVKGNQTGGGPYAMVDGAQPIVGYQGQASDTRGTGISLGGRSVAHGHSFLTNGTGSSGVNANLPPYRALNWIKRVS